MKEYLRYLRHNLYYLETKKDREKGSGYERI